MSFLFLFLFILKFRVQTLDTHFGIVVLFETIYLRCLIL